jgi:hypothetical protein
MPERADGLDWSREVNAELSGSAEGGREGRGEEVVMDGLRSMVDYLHRAGGRSAEGPNFDSRKTTAKPIETSLKVRLARRRARQKW